VKLKTITTGLGRRIISYPLSAFDKGEIGLAVRYLTGLESAFMKYNSAHGIRCSGSSIFPLLEKLRNRTNFTELTKEEYDQVIEFIKRQQEQDEAEKRYRQEEEQKEREHEKWLKSHKQGKIYYEPGDYGRAYVVVDGRIFYEERHEMGG